MHVVVASKSAPGTFKQGHVQLDRMNGGKVLPHRCDHVSHVGASLHQCIEAVSSCEPLDQALLDAMGSRPGPISPEPQKELDAVIYGPGYEAEAPRGKGRLQSIHQCKPCKSY